MKITEQASFRVSRTGIVSAVCALIAYVAGKYFGDQTLGGLISDLIAAILLAVGIGAANYSSPLAERGAKAETKAVAADTAQAVATETAATVAAETVAAIRNGEDV